MTYKIGPDGWVTGSLPGPGVVEYPIEKHECPRPGNEPYRRLEKTPPDLCLHTTEGTDLDSAIATLKAKFSPSQWACGENRIAQLRPLWAQGAAVDTQNAYLMQVENVAKSQTTLWLPVKETLSPLVALVAMLHREHIITSGTSRPKALEGLPLVLDRMPAAVSTYYRRSLAPEPTHDGVRGHVDLKDDEHWDPGSFDYPTFFQLVEGVIGDDEMSAEDKVKLEKAATSAERFEDYLNGQQLVLAGKPLPADHSQAMAAGFQVMTAAVNRPKPGTANLPKSEVVTIVRKA